MEKTSDRIFPLGLGPDAAQGSQTVERRRLLSPYLFKVTAQRLAAHAQTPNLSLLTHIFFNEIVTLHSDSRPHLYCHQKKKIVLYSRVALSPPDKLYDLH